MYRRVLRPAPVDLSVFGLVLVNPGLVGLSTIHFVLADLGLIGLDTCGSYAATVELSAVVAGTMGPFVAVRSDF